MARAVAEVPVDVSMIGATIAQAVQAKSEANAAKDVARWRVLVTDIATGKVAAEKCINELTDIAQRLRLPSSAISADVQAIQNLAGNRTLLAEQEVKRDKARADGELAAKEIEGLEARLRRCREQMRLGTIMPTITAGTARAIDELQRNNPRLWGDIDTIAKEIADRA